MKAALTASQYSESPDIESSSDDYATRFSGEVGRWFLEVQLRALLPMLPKGISGQSALDVGGGHGQILPGLLTAGFKVAVLGSNTTCSNRIRSFIDRSECEFKEGSLLDLSFADRSFEVVTSFRMLSHLNRWERHLEELFRVSNNLVIVDYPSTRSINALAPALFGLKKKIESNTRGFLLFSREQLQAVAQSHGFKILAATPQFFFPMAIHRAIGSRAISSFLESVAGFLGLTKLFGSPVVLSFVRAT